MKKITKEELKNLKKNDLVAYKFYYVPNQINFITGKTTDNIEAEELFKYGIVIHNDIKNNLLFLKVDEDIMVVNINYADLYK